MENRGGGNTSQSSSNTIQIPQTDNTKIKVQINIHHEYRQKNPLKILANKIQQYILAMNMGALKLKVIILFTIAHKKEEYLG